MCNSCCLNSFCSVCLFWCCLLGNNRKWWVFSFYPCLKIQKWYFWRKGLLCSLSRVTVHVTLWWILTKICILVEEVQLQLIQGKIFMVAAFTLHLFLPGKKWKKTNFLRTFIERMLTPFLFGITRTVHTILKLYYHNLFWKL